MAGEQLQDPDEVDHEEEHAEEGIAPEGGGAAAKAKKKAKKVHRWAP